MSTKVEISEATFRLTCECGEEIEFSWDGVFTDWEEALYAAADEHGWADLQCEDCQRIERDAMRGDFLYDQWKERQLEEQRGQ